MNADSFLRSMQRVVGPLRNRVLLMVGRAVLTAVNEEAKLQKLQLVALDKEPLDGVERFQNFGFSSHPLAGATAILLSLGGSRNHAIAVAVDDERFRPRDLAPGESVVYSAYGDYIKIKDGHIIEVVAAERVAVSAPRVVVTASVELLCDTPVFKCTGEILDRCTDDGVSMSEMRGIFNDHNHGGVQPGAGNTNTPNQDM